MSQWQQAPWVIENTVNDEAILVNSKTRQAMKIAARELLLWRSLLRTTVSSSKVYSQADVGVLDRWYTQGMICQKKEDEIMNELNVDMQKSYVWNPDVVVREEEEEGCLLYNPDTNQVKILNITAMYIWQQCDGKKTLAQIVEGVLTTFEGATDDEVYDDAKAFVLEMIHGCFLGERS